MEVNPQISITSDEARQNPVAFLSQVREATPVYIDPVTGFYVVTRYSDVSFVNEHPDLFGSQNEVLMGRSNSPVASEVKRRFDERGFPEVHTLVTADPPAHTRYRRLVERAFTPSYVNSFRPRIHSLVDELIDGFIDRGECDLAWEYAFLLPLYIITEQIGVPREDFRRIRHWSDLAVERADATISAERELVCADGIIEMQNYLVGYARQYRDKPANNLLSTLANFEDDEGRKLTDAELVSIAFQILVGGNETTANAILSVVNELVRNPLLMAQVRADRSLLPGVIEETLRLHSPSPNFPRVCKADCEIEGIKIPQGSTVIVSYMGANYDPRKFEAPCQLNPQRKSISHHLSFGRGPHHCVGRNLASAELTIAISKLLDRLINIQFHADYPWPEYQPHAFIHAIGPMHIAFEKQH